MDDCLVCGLDPADCECFDGVFDVPHRAADHELVTIAVLDATDVLDGVPGFPNFF